MVVKDAVLMELSCLKWDGEWMAWSLNILLHSRLGTPGFGTRSRWRSKKWIALNCCLLLLNVANEPQNNYTINILAFGLPCIIWHAGDVCAKCQGIPMKHWGKKKQSEKKLVNFNQNIGRARKTQAPVIEKHRLERLNPTL